MITVEIINANCDIDDLEIETAFSDNKLLRVDDFPVNCKTFERNTPLIIACKLNNWIVANRLLDKGADVNVMNTSGFNVLFCIADSINYDERSGVFERILEKNIDINTKNDDGMTAICYCRTYKMIKRFMDNGADITNFSPIRTMIESGFNHFTDKEVDELFELFITPATADNFNTTLQNINRHLYGPNDVQQRRIVKCINRYLDVGASLLVGSKNNDDTYVFPAYNIIKAILSWRKPEKQLNINLIYRLMTSDTVKQISNRKDTIAECIVDNIKLPITYKLIKRLITEYGVDIDKTNMDDESLLLIACRTGKGKLHPQYLQRIQLLISSKTINRGDINGETPLMAAAKVSRNPDLVKLLLEKKADKLQTDKQGKQAYQYCRKRRGYYYDVTSYHLLR